MKDGSVKLDILNILYESIVNLEKATIVIVLFLFNNIFIPYLLKHKTTAKKTNFLFGKHFVCHIPKDITKKQHIYELQQLYN